jgi:hypothetical protein
VTVQREGPPPAWVAPSFARIPRSLEGDGLARQTADVRFPFRFTDDDQRDLRWYLEDYLQAPEEPHPKIAARVERRMAALGAELFKAIFQGDDARDLWATLRARLAKTRVEVVTGVREATSIPWELLRDPKTDLPLALRARSFVRALPNPAEAPQLPRLKAGTPLRTLLVICRPYGRNDVPFRSVSARILKSLDEAARQVFDFDVLRPPTFEALSATLRHARAEGKPYQIVHFDGHGGFLDMEQLLAGADREDSDGSAVGALSPSPPAPIVGATLPSSGLASFFAAGPSPGDKSPGGAEPASNACYSESSTSASLLLLSLNERTRLSPKPSEAGQSYQLRPTS